MPVADLLPEIAVLLAAVILLLLPLFLSVQRQAFGAALALLALLASAVLCTMQLGEAPRLTFAGTWALDGASIWARLLILAASAAVVPLAPDWLRGDRRHGEYYSVLLMGVLGAMLLAGAADLLLLVMAVLLSSVTGYTLAAYHRGWALSLEAGMKYFLVGAFANTLLLVGVALMFGLVGGTRLAEIAPALVAAPHAPLLPIGLVLLVVGIAFKLGAVPAHPWVPDVVQGAPVPSAAFLTVVPKIGAAVALARLLHAFPSDVVGWQPLVAVLSVATMTLGNLMALWQTDLRRLLGWSSVSQAGYALMAVAVLGLSRQAVPALLFFLAGYAAANVAAFAAVAHLRGRTALGHYRGLARVRPWVAAALVLSLLSLVGIPPLGGFVGKLALFLAAIDGGYTWLAVAAVANTVVSLFYYLRVIAPMVFDPPTGEVATLGHWSGAGLLCAAVSIAALGLLAPMLLWARLGGAVLLLP